MLWQEKKKERKKIIGFENDVALLRPRRRRATGPGESEENGQADDFIC